MKPYDALQRTAGASAMYSTVQYDRILILKKTWRSWVKYHCRNRGCELSMTRWECGAFSMLCRTCASASAQGARWWGRRGGGEQGSCGSTWMTVSSHSRLPPQFRQATRRPCVQNVQCGTVQRLHLSSSPRLRAHAKSILPVAIPARCDTQLLARAPGRSPFPACNSLSISQSPSYMCPGMHSNKLLYRYVLCTNSASVIVASLYIPFSNYLQFLQSIRVMLSPMLRFSLCQLH